MKGRQMQDDIEHGLGDVEAGWDAAEGSVVGLPEVPEPPSQAAAGAEGFEAPPVPELVPLPFDEEPEDAPPLEALPEDAPDIEALDAVLAALDEEPGDAPSEAKPPVVEVASASADTEPIEAVSEATGPVVAEPTAPPLEPTPVAEGVSPEPPADTAPAGEMRPFDVPEQRPGYTPWIPFAVYAVVWLGFAVAVNRYFDTMEGNPLVSAEYGYSVWAGIALAALGPILGIVAYVVSRMRVERERRDGLFVRVFLLAAVTTSLGVGLWWGALYLLGAAA